MLAVQINAAQGKAETLVRVCSMRRPKAEHVIAYRTRTEVLGRTMKRAKRKRLLSTTTSAAGFAINHALMSKEFLRQIFGLVI